MEEYSLLIYIQLTYYNRITKGRFSNSANYKCHSREEAGRFNFSGNKHFYYWGEGDFQTPRINTSIDEERIDGLIQAILF